VSGNVCTCPESRKPPAERRWEVTQRRCNHSAFAGYRRTPSRFSAVRCAGCRRIWRTAARYVDLLPDAPEGWWRR
jgi:hypothetical protein